MGELIGILLILVVAYLLIVYVIAPIAGILLTITSVLAFGYAFYTSMRSFIASLTNHKTPYTTYVDKSPNAQPGTKRNYFFGPGYHQIVVTVKEAFSRQNNYLATLKGWRSRHTGNLWYRDMWIWIFYVMAVFCTFVLGYAWIIVFSTLLSVALFFGMCGFYVFFMSLCGVDRLLLMLKSISSRCLNCKKIAVVPVFECPNCGMKHRKLTPGPYGVL